MFSFLRFLSEEAVGMVSTIGSDRKGKRHTENYVMPYLSAEGRKKTAESFAKHGGFRTTGTGHGEKHDPNAESTHTLRTAQNGHPAGTQVKVTHVTVDEPGNITVHTKDHGSFKQAALLKPGELKRPFKSERGFKVESRIAKNLGTQAAGPTKHGYDFQYSAGSKSVKGKVKEASEAPPVRGESKLDRGKMGQSTLKHDKEKGWHFTDKAIGSHFEKAHVKDPSNPGSTLPLLDYLNKHHSNGKIEKGFSVDAPKGATRNYLNNSGVNALHLHNKVKDKGTTFTVGNTHLKGKTKLGHLTDEHLNALDGKISIEKTTIGQTQAAHRPNIKVMKQYANMSQTNPNEHRDLSNEEHASEFKAHVDKIK